MMSVLGLFSWTLGDLGGHLDFTRRARAGTLSRRVREATLVWCAALEREGGSEQNLKKKKQN